MRLSEIQNKYEQAVRDLVANFNVGFTNMGEIIPMSEDELLKRTRANGVIYGLAECDIENKSEKEIRIPIKIYEIRCINFTGAMITTYDDWPETTSVFLKHSQIAKGFGDYVQNNRPSVSVINSLVNLADFEKILDADVLFDFKAGKEVMTYSGFDYMIRGKDPVVKFTDVFDLQDYLMSTDKWKTFFTQP